MLRAQVSTNYQKKKEEILEEMKTRKRKLSIARIDYWKAFDNVLHSWILKIPEIYRICYTKDKFITENYRKTKQYTGHWHRDQSTSKVTSSMEINCHHCSSAKHYRHSDAYWTTLAVNTSHRMVNWIMYSILMIVKRLRSMTTSRKAQSPLSKMKTLRCISESTNVSKPISKR